MSLRDHATQKRENTGPCFIATAEGIVLAQVLDPVTAQQIVGIITGMGG
ncbi:hypothetical protein [Methanoregula sp.]|jgi:hypothetical protein